MNNKTIEALIRIGQLAETVKVRRRVIATAEESGQTEEIEGARASLRHDEETLSSELHKMGEERVVYIGKDPCGPIAKKLEGGEHSGIQAAN